MSMVLDSDIFVFEDKENKVDWRVEYFDDDGCCFVIIFGGPDAERRARDYAGALKAGTLRP